MAPESMEDWKDGIMKRREFLMAAAVAGVGLAVRGAALPAKAPFRVLYGNDTTNIISCLSPYHAARQEFSDAMLRASIDEAAGADAHLLQPGMGWIPWWKSKVCPAEAHYTYYREKYGLAPNSFGKYMLAGGDMVKTFVAHCRARGIAPLVSLRLNDAHGLETVGSGAAMAMHTVSRFYEDHYREWRIGPDQNSADQHVLNWAVPEVRAQKAAFIRELCEGYDLAGLELDFMRHSSFFRLNETTSAQRRRIMTGFVAEARRTLDAATRSGRRRWLCVRLPALLEAHDRLGLDVAELAAAGVDMFNLSCSYFTVQQTDLPAIRRLVPRAAVYLEMAHSTLNGKPLDRYDSFPFLRTTPQQYATTARLAYAQGADGVSLFNFVYTREHGRGERGPFAEPAFELLGRLGDRAWLARQPQWYFIGASMKKPLASAWPLPKVMKKGARVELKLEMLPDGSRVLDGLLRLRMAQVVPGGRWRAMLNGAALEPCPWVRQPLEHAYDAWQGEPEQHACFKVPRAAARVGGNTVAIEMLEGAPAQLEFVDLVLP